MGVQAALLQQLCMGAFLQDSALPQQQNLVTETCACQSVGDKEGSFLLGKLVVFCVQFALCQGIQSRCGLIQHQYWGFLVQGPCQQQFLFLAAGEVLGAVLDSFYQGQI